MKKMIKQSFKKISVLTMNPTLDSGESSSTSLYNRGVLDQRAFTASFVIKREGNPGTSNAPFLMREVDTEFDMVTHRTRHIS